MTTLIERIEMARKDRTDADILRAAGLKPDIIRNLKDGKARLPRVDTALALARGLGVNPSWLAFELGPREMTDRDEIVRLVADMSESMQTEAIRLLQHLKRLQPGQLQGIVDFVQHFPPLDEQRPQRDGGVPPASEPSP